MPVQFRMQEDGLRPKRILSRRLLCGGGRFVLRGLGFKLCSISPPPIEKAALAFGGTHSGPSGIDFYWTGLRPAMDCTGTVCWPEFIQNGVSSLKGWPTIRALPYPWPSKWGGGGGMFTPPDGQSNQACDRHPVPTHRPAAGGPRPPRPSRRSCGNSGSFSSWGPSTLGRSAHDAPPRCRPLPSNAGCLAAGR